MGVLNNLHCHHNFSKNRKLIHRIIPKQAADPLPEPDLWLKVNPEKNQPRKKNQPRTRKKIQNQKKIRISLNQNPQIHFQPNSLPLQMSRSKRLLISSTMLSTQRRTLSFNFKMGVLNNFPLNNNTFDIREYIKYFKGQIQTGFKLDANNNYDRQQKRLGNVGEGVDADDAVTKHQMEVGLSSKSDQTSVLLLDGRNHMTGDLDLRGNKIILPGGVDMDRKLITNLDTDLNQDLSAVNMVTLKNNVRPKADKNYVDGEITKLVKKTGDVLSGDLILPHDSYPVQGNTNKAVSYETQREIFLSRKESFPMETDINMNNNFIQNVATPTSSHQGANKGYCDYNFLNRQKGGRIMGSLSMNQNDLFEIPAPKFGSSAVNKNYVDGFLKKTGDQMSGDLDIGGNKINNVGTPDTNENDAAVNVGFFNTELNASNANLTNAYKQYVDHSHVSPSGLQTDVFRYLMEDTDDSSSENNIRVTRIVDFVASAHQINKKAYEFTLVKDTDGSNDYRSRIGFNLFKLPLGYYTFVVEYFPPEMNNVIVTAQGTTISIASQTTKTFGNYTKTLVKFHNFSKTTPDFIFINLHGKTTSSTTGHLIVYGVKGYVSSVEPKVYDTAFVVENGKMTMETDIDLNGKSILSLPTTHWISGAYKKV